MSLETLNALFKIHQEHIEYMNQVILEVIRRQNLIIDFIAETNFSHPKKQTSRFKSFRLYK